MDNEYREIQEDLFEYFKDVDNKMLSEFVDAFVYHNSTQDTKVSEFTDKFLKDNGLTEIYIKYVLDVTDRKKYFSRTTMSESSMIDQIKSGMLSLAYNRFREVLAKPKAKSTPLVRLKKQEKKDLTMVIKGCERHNDDLMDDEPSSLSFVDKEDVDEIVNERKRLKDLFTKVLNIIN